MEKTTRPVAPVVFTNGEAEAAWLRSEQRYRALSAATAQIVAISTADCEFCTEQEQWQKFTRQSNSDVQGLGWADAIHPDDKEYFLRRLRTACKSPQSFRCDFRLKRH